MTSNEPRRGKRPDWWPWVREQMRTRWGKENVARLARDAGINPTAPYQWQDGADVEPVTVGRVAAALGVNPIEAYIAAGFFTADQFAAYLSAGAELSNAALADEVRRRMDGACPTGGRGPTPGGGGGPDVASLPATQGADVTSTSRPAGGRRTASEPER